MRKGTMGRVPEPPLRLGLGAGPPCQAPPNQAVCPPGQRAEARLLCVPSFLGTEEAGLGSCHRQLLWALKLKEGMAWHSRVPFREGAVGAEHGIQATGLSEMTDVNVTLSFMKHLCTRRRSRIVSLNLDSSPERWAFSSRFIDEDTEAQN